MFFVFFSYLILKYFCFSPVLQKLRFSFFFFLQLLKRSSKSLNLCSESVQIPWWPFKALLKSISLLWCTNPAHGVSEECFLSRAKAQPCFQSIASVLVFWRAVSVQALDNALFDGVQWLTRPHLSPRPLLLSSPHALPCKTKRTQTSTHWLMYAHTLPFSLSLHPSSGGF